MTALRRPVIVLTALALAAAVAPAAAQKLPGKKGAPVQIEADKGIEWRQKKKVYIARGNATVTRGNITVRAETLTAHYRGKPTTKKPTTGGVPTTGGTDIWQVTAAGGVKITQGDRVITGGYAVYNMDSGVFRLTGGRIKMESPSESITATQKIEYRSKQKIAYVVGNAVAIKEDKKVRADRFTAYFADDAKGQLALEKVVAEGGVVITTPTEVARGDKATYNNRTGLAEIVGSVKLTRGDNQLNGDRAEVNLKTGISRLLASSKGSGRVRGLFIPSGDTGGAAPTGKGPLVPGVTDSKKKKAK